MPILALTSLFECLENTHRMILLGEINKQQLKETITSLLNTLTRLGPKFDNDERVNIEKENIRIFASKLEYRYMESLIADDLGLVTIATKTRQFVWYFKHQIAILKYEMSEDDHFPSSTANSVLSSEVAADNKDNLLSVGLEQSLKQLLVELTGSTRKLELVGVVGMAGIGKTTLAKMIFQTPCVIQHFDIRAWVKCSQSHSKSDMLLQVLKCINQQRNDDVLDQTETDLEETVYKILKRQRYLIVVDDLWSAQAWNETRRLFSDDFMGSRILFTSRQNNVMEDLNCKNIHQMSLLGDQTSWDLLQKRVFSHDTCPPDLIDIGKQIAKKCEGLPLAIVVIAGILLKTSKKVESWKRIAESVSSLALSSANPCGEMIALSYKHLPAHLKSCFLYMGAFPGAGSEIETKVLARLWIAEGFVTPRYSDNLEQVADGYLKDLIDRSLVLTASKRFNGNVKTCRLHDLLLEFCIKQAREEKFLDVIKDYEEEEDLGGEEEDSGGKERIKGYEKNHRPCRYSFHCNTFKDIPPKSQARTALFTVNNFNPRVLPIPGRNAFPVSLRKLTLSRSHLPWEKMNIMSELPYLEVLKLRNYAFQGTDWETKGGGFQCLTYLLIENTDLTHWSLECDDCFPRLQRLVLKFCSLLEEIPEQIGDIPTLSFMELRFCSNSAEQSAKNIQEQQKEECCHSIEVHIQKKVVTSRRF